MSELNLKALAAAVAGAVAVASFAAPSFAQGMGDSKGKVLLTKLTVQVLQF